MNLEVYKANILEEIANCQVCFLTLEGIVLESCNSIFSFMVGENVFEKDPFWSSMNETLSLIAINESPLFFPKVGYALSEEDDNKYDFYICKKVDFKKREYLVWTINDVSRDNEYITSVVTNQRVAEIKSEVLEIQNKNILLENELVKLKNSELERAKKIKNEIFSKASHELRSPLNGIIGIINILSKNDGNESQNKNYLESLGHISSQLKTVVDDLLDLNKLEAGKIVFNNKPFSLHNLCESIRYAFADQVSHKKIRLNYHLSQNLPNVVSGDSVRLGQILNNLLSNAIKFTHQGGDVTLDIQVIQQTDSEAKLLFKVKDTGIGISKCKLEHVFEPFTQEKDDTSVFYGGTGLGLTIVKQLVENQGGTIWVESEEGKGTIFSFDLSFNLEKEVENILDILRLPTTAIDKKISVLIAEDNPINVLILKKYLSSFNFDINVANDGNECLEKLRKTSKDYQLLLLDLSMPKVNGDEVLKVIEEEKLLNENVPVIILSGYTQQEISKEYPEMKYDDYLLKPYEQNQIVKKVQKHLMMLLDI